jgi:diguanylate cyclase (GGDEF)-like protein
VPVALGPQSDLSLPVYAQPLESAVLPAVTARAPGGRVLDEPVRPVDLARLAVFQGVEPEALAGLPERCTVRKLDTNEMLLARGQTSGTMFIVLSGQLAVHVDSIKGEPVAVLDRGQTVGEVSVIDQSPSPAWVRATVPTRLLALDDEAFWGLAHASHAFAINLLYLFSQRVRASHTALSEGARRRRQLERNAYVDALTGCCNRRWLDERLPRLVHRFAVASAPLSLLVLDVDHFKRFNDDYGHPAGDQVLASVGQTLIAALRPTDMAVRYGGEEYVVLLPETPLAGARIAAERLRARVAATGVTAPDGRALPPVTISIGVAELQPRDTAEVLLARADRALYRAKQGGRNRVEA